MKVKSMTGVMALLLLSGARANYEDRIMAQSNKQFFSVEETEKSFVETPIGAKKHMAVQSGEVNLCDRPICLFVDSFTGKGMDEPDHLCLTSVGSMNSGFKWSRSQQKYSKSNGAGFLKVDFIAYLKGESQGEIDFLISRILKHTLELLLGTTSVEFHQQLAYYTFEDKMCMDVFFKTSSIEFIADMSMQFAECYKYLIDSMGDFGQADDHPKYSDSTRKPFFDFARFIDKCEFSDSETITVKSFRQDSFSTYFVGDGTSGDACFPGNVISWITGVVEAATPPELRVAGQRSGFTENYVKPWMNVAVMKGMQYLHDIAEDGEHKIHDDLKWNTDEFEQKDLYL